MSSLGLRVLIFSLSIKDAESSQRVLEKSGIQTLICRSIQEVCVELQNGCGAMILAKEVLDGFAIELINKTVSTEGKWSFIPIVVLISSGDLRRNNEALKILKPLRNTTLLERPVRVSTFISIINAAISDRSRQYEVRDLLSQLEQAKLDAEAASRAKSDFLANMSHEIRTPLGAILGFSELLIEAEISHKEKLHYLQTMKRNGQLLSSLISDVLDLSKVESGKIDVEYLDTSIRELISEITTAHQPDAAKKEINMHVEFDKDLPTIICTDPLRLKQIISNIVGNAIKFTKHGDITMELSSKIKNGTKMLVIRIQDTGIGMSKDQSSRLFQPFTQADNSITRKYGGTGLGLTLSKKLAQLLGGDLVLANTFVNQGTAFEISVDISQSAESSIPFHMQDEETTGPVLAGRKILIVDDSQDNQMLISHLLKLSGANVETASDGLEGIEKAMGNAFDVILMDIQMPRLGGHEAIRRLRANDYKKPIIALTAYALKEEIDQCFEAGCNYYLTKPIHRGKLIQTISRCVTDMVRNQKTSEPKKTHTFHT